MSAINERAVPEKLQVLLDASAAKSAITTAWTAYRRSTIRHYNEGLDFGRVCYEWRTKYRAQGSHAGKGFDRLLGIIGIPKTTAYRWIRRYELRNGLRAKRHEAEGNNQDRQKALPYKLVSFRVFVAPDQRRQFADDIEMLGGFQKVAALFVEFVSRLVFEKRNADPSILETAEDYRRTA
jgi:hypothetical protein